jgi:hypothetical protein
LPIHFGVAWVFAGTGGCPPSVEISGISKPKVIELITVGDEAKEGGRVVIEVIAQEESARLVGRRRLVRFTSS